MMVFASRFKPAILVACLAVFSTTAPAAPDAAATIVLFNKNDPDSRDLAKYYAGRRGIPSSQVAGLDCPVMEEIQRSDYETTIADPLRKLFRARGWWKTMDGPAGDEVVVSSTIRYVAIMRGMPLKIAHDPSLPPARFVKGLPEVIASRNEASVDSELATLGMPLPGPGGIFPNPYFQRFTAILENPVYPGLLLPARLDGPTPFLVRAMIDDSITAERDGLYGWSYVDGRGITDGGYAEGDRWMGKLVDSMRTAGLPVIFDNNPPTFPAGYPITDAAVYYGWYAGDVEGPFADARFQFRPGAIAVHIHSSSASTLLSTTANWCGPLLARGAAATLGNVYEPYLSLTANLDIFQDRLMAGFTLAESAWMSQRALSWMGVVVGDPLYRPYASWHPGETTASPGNWQIYRGIVLNTPGGVLQAAGPLRKKAAETKESLFVEALGAARMDAKDWSGALQSFQEAEKLAKNPAVRIRLDLETLASLVALGKKTEAVALALATAAGLPPGARRDLFSQFSTGPLPAPSAEPPAASPSPSPLPPPPLPELRP